MAAVSCPLQRTFSRFNLSQAGNTPVLCREPLWVLSVQRYGRDRGFSLYFPQAITTGDSLYDATLTDGDCRIRVTLDPSLNRLVERNVFHCGAQLQHVNFLPRLAAQEEEGEAAEEVWCRTYRVVSLEVSEEAEGEGESEGLVAGVQVERLLWYGTPRIQEVPGGPRDRERAPSLLPLRAKRSCYLALWNNQDHYGPAWRETSASIQTDSEEPASESAGLRPTVTLRKLREDFLSHSGGVSTRRGMAKGMLVVRVLNKSRVMYYGKSDSNCKCPYKAVLEVCDTSVGGCMCVLWNSVCVCWYVRLQPGQLLRLRGYRVKERYDTRTTDQQDIEISLNSRNPSAEISILPESSLPADVPLSRPSFSFCSGKELFSLTPGNICDVIGLVLFSGRPERIRSKIGQGSELLEYRWLRLEDGTSDQPIMIKLFSTSQPEIHSKIYPLSVVVVTRLLLDRASTGFYLTNTSYTQVYCTGSGHHSTMHYRKLPHVCHFIQWLQSLNERQVLSRAVVGGYFIYPPPHVSLEMFMKNRTGEPGPLTGSELKREVEQLQYRERRRFCIQATIKMVTHCRKGEDDHCLVWTDKQAASLSPHPSSSLCLSSSSSPCPSSISSHRPCSSPCPPPSSPHLHSSPHLSTSSPRLSPSSSGSLIKLSPRLLRLRAGLGLCNGKSPKRRLFSSPGPPRKRLTLPDRNGPEEDTDGSLWEASMEFLQADDDEDEEEGVDEQAGLTTPSSPLPLSKGLGLAHIAMETLPLMYCPATREEQAIAVGMQTEEIQNLPQCSISLEKYRPTYSYTQTGHYTLTLRALSDGVVVNAVFLPGSSTPFRTSGPSPLHGHHWSSILTHGGFSPHTPPPAPADLIATASQLANQRLVCVLEACFLGGDRVELVLSRAFPLRD